MQKIFSLIIFTMLFLSTPYVDGQSVENLTAFDRATLAYTDGDYLTALQTWQGISENGEVSAALFFNIGNAAYQLNRVGQAVLFFEKALVLAPHTEDIIFNLAKAQGRAVDRFTIIPEPFWLRGWSALATFFGPAGMLIIGFLLLLFAGILFGRQLWFGTVNPWRRRLLVVIFPIALFFSAGGMYASYQIDTQHRLVVMDAETPLFNSASTDDPSELVVHEGLVVKQITDNGLWAEVRLSNGTEGWLPITATAQI